MIKLNTINFNNKTKKNITFKNTNNITPDVAVLSLQSPDAMVNFEKDFNIARQADAVQSNPLRALAYKIYKTAKVLFGPRKTSNPELEAAIYTYA